MRNIEHVEFWKVDADRRRVGIREAPDYDLARAKDAIDNDLQPDSIENTLREANA